MTVDEALALFDEHGIPNVDDFDVIAGQLLSTEVRRLTQAVDALLTCRDGSVRDLWLCNSLNAASANNRTAEARISKLEAENASLREYKSMYEGLCK